VATLPTPTPDLSLESERKRIFAEARVISERLAQYTKLIHEWAMMEGTTDAVQ